jgi:hypothetical protein
VLGITPIVRDPGSFVPDPDDELDDPPLDAAALDDDDELLLPQALRHSAITPAITSTDSRLTFRKVLLLSQAESKTPARPVLARHPRSLFYQPIG